MNQNVNMNVHNKFEIEVINSKTGKVNQRAIAYNVICDQLWERFMRSYFWGIQYGSGDGVPTSSDRSLFNLIGYKRCENHAHKFDPKNGRYSMTKKIVLNSTDAVGKTITEVGIAWDKYAGTLCTHAMLEDMNGNKISITKTDTDIITIYATIYVTWSPEAMLNKSLQFCQPLYGKDSMFMRTIVGDDIDTGIAQGPAIEWFRAAASNESGYGYANRGNSATLTPSKVTNRFGDGFVSGPTDTVAVNVSFDTSSKKMLLKAERLSADLHNMAGLSKILVFVQPKYGDATECLDIRVGDWFANHTVFDEPLGTGDGVTTKFRTAFTRAKNAKVMIDGISDSSAKVIYDPYPAGSDMSGSMHSFFEYLDEDSTPSNHVVMGYGKANFSPKYHIFDHNVPVIIGYNPFYELGLAHVSTSRADLYCSNDLSSWTLLRSNTEGQYDIPAEHAHKKYWKLVKPVDMTDVGFNGGKLLEYDGMNIILTKPPKQGAVVTCTYDIDGIPKDKDHVLDMSLEFNFG